MAIRQALNPALLTELEEEEEDEEMEEEDEEDPKSKKGKRKNNSVAPKTNVKAAPAKRKNRKATTDSNKMQESKSEQVQQERKKRVSYYIKDNQKGRGGIDGIFYHVKSVNQCLLRMRKKRIVKQQQRMAWLVKNHQNIKRSITSDINYSVSFIIKKR